MNRKKQEKLKKKKLKFINTFNNIIKQMALALALAYLLMDQSSRNHKYYVRIVCIISYNISPFYSLTHMHASFMYDDDLHIRKEK